MSSQFLQDKLNSLWRETRDAFRETPKKGSKRERETLARLGMLRRAQAGWSSLLGWVELSDEEIGSHPSARALLDAGLALIEDPEIMKLALPMLAGMAIARDKPAAWDELSARGFDGAASREMLLARGYRSWRMDPRAGDSMSWLSKAVEARSWRCALRLAKLPAGKSGAPGVDRMTAEEEEAARAISEFIGRMEDEGRERDWEADWWRNAHPLLLGWHSHAEEAPGSRRCPEEVFAALRSEGMGEAWGEPGFAKAAADLAMEGSVPAALACAANGIDPNLALPESSRAPRLALEGASGAGSEQEQAAWAAVAAWMDGREAGSSARLARKAAMEWLADLRGNEWRVSGDEARTAPKILAALAKAGPNAADPGADLALLQEWAIEIAERAAERAGTRGFDAEGVSALRKALDKTMKSWDEVVPSLSGAPRARSKILRA